MNFITFFIRTSIIFSLLTLISACSQSPLQQFIDKTFPPKALSEIEQKAQESLAVQMVNTKNPAFGFSVSLAMLKDSLDQEQLKQEGIISLELSSQRQLLHAEIAFNVDVLDYLAERKILPNDLLKQAAPVVSGTINFGMGLSFELEDDSQIIGITVLPYYESMRIDRFTAADGVKLENIANEVLGFIGQYRDNLNGWLGSQSWVEVTVPNELVKTLKAEDYHGTHQIEGGAATVTGQDIQAAYRLGALALKVDDNKLMGIISLENSLSDIGDVAMVDDDGTQVVLEELITETKIKAIGSENALDGSALFDSVFADAFPEYQYASPASVAMDKSFISTFLTQTFSQASLCVDANNQFQERTRETIDMPSGEAIDCRSSRACSKKRNCDFKPKVDKRKCGKVCAHVPCPTWSKPLRTCKKCLKDYACEAAKGAQNDLYRIEAAGKKVDCERIREQNYLACKAEMAAEKLACETIKAAVTGLDNTGNFANIDLNLKGDVNAKVCLNNASFSPSLDNLAVGLTVQGALDSELDFKFTPLDIVGHLVCQFPWTEDYRIRAQLQSQKIDLETTIDLQIGYDKGTYAYTLAPFPVEVELKDSPQELFKQTFSSLNMNLACPIVGTVSPLLVSIAHVIPDTTSMQRFDSETIEGKGDFDLPSLTIQGKSYPLEGKNTERNIHLYIAPAQ